MAKKIVLVVLIVMIAGSFVLSVILSTPIQQGKSQYLSTTEYQIIEMSLDGQGNIWACAKQMATGPSNYVLSFRGTELVATYALTDTDTGRCNSIIVAPNGNLLVGYDYGLIKIFDGKSWKTKIREVPNISLITTLAVDRLGNIWVGSFGDGIGVYDGRTWKSYQKNNSPLGEDSINVITFDQEDRAWIGTDNGYYVLDGQNWQAYRNPANESVETIAFDSNGRVWIGQGKNVIVLEGDNQKRFTPDNSGLMPVPVRNIMFDDQGRTWILQGRELVRTEKDVLSVYSGNQWKYFFESNESNHYALSEMDRAGQVLLVTHEKLVSVSTKSSNLLPKFLGMLRLFVASGGWLFVAITLLLILVIYMKNSSKVIWAGFGVGAVMCTLSVINTFSDYPTFYNPDFNFGIASLGFFLMLGGVIGGFSGTNKSQAKDPKAEARGVFWGWIIGLAIYVFLQNLPQA